MPPLSSPLAAWPRRRRSPASSSSSCCCSVRAAANDTPSPQTDEPTSAPQWRGAVRRWARVCPAVQSRTSNPQALSLMHVAARLRAHRRLRVPEDAAAASFLQNTAAARSLSRPKQPP